MDIGAASGLSRVRCPDPWRWGSPRRRDQAAVVPNDGDSAASGGCPISCAESLRTIDDPYESFVRAIRWRSDPLPVAFGLHFWRRGGDH